MRSDLLEPLATNAKLALVIDLARELYALFEAGQDCASALRKLAKLAGLPIHRCELEAAFGSVQPETFARKLLVSWDALPLDVTKEEMLEMLERICNARGSEFQLGYWVQCLRANTGDERISDLIYWPGEYFGEDVSRELTAAEILGVALKSGGRGLAA